MQLADADARLGSFRLCRGIREGQTRCFHGGTIMEPVNIISMSQQDVSTIPSPTLEQARERMIRLLSEAESNAWEIGDLLNKLENQGLARRKGYGKTRTWLEAEVPGAAGKTTTLYRYAVVAAVYTKQQVGLWGISKLELLMAHDQGVLGHSDPEDPVNRDVQLVQPNGSLVIKKFHDCSWRDLQQSTQNRRKDQKAPGKKTDCRRRSEVRSLKHSSPGTEGHSLRLAPAMLALGIVLFVISEILPSGWISAWVFVAGAGCFLGGIGILVSHWHDFRERLTLAVKEGRALEFLKQQLDHAGRGAQKLATAICSKLKSAQAPTSSPEESPPSEKKAA